MEKSFWETRWAAGEIGFHQADINRYLLRYWNDISQQQTGRVFVPLCGKSRDMLWLRDQGHDVLGIEFSAQAVDDFFTENALIGKLADHPRFTLHQADSLELFCGDFFELTAEDLQDCHLVYDRAALVALPEAMRKQYSEQLSRVLPKPTRVLLVVMEYPQQEMGGPPFSVTPGEVERLFSRDFQVSLLESFDIYKENPRFQAKGLTSLKEHIFLLSR